MIIVEKEAFNIMCPHTEDFDHCLASSCMAWRWVPLSVDEPGYMAAIKAAIGTMPEGAAKALTAQTAPKWVNENRAALGLRTQPYRGYCGLAGKPE